MTVAAELGLAATAEGLRSGELDLQARIEQAARRFQEREPRVLAFLPEDGRFERLHREAEELLAAYPLGQPADGGSSTASSTASSTTSSTASETPRPLLFGVLVGVKDVFRAEGFPTRAGSRLPPELFAGPEASSVTALRRAGALVLGKTVSTEFAYFAPGPTRNPHDATRTPGGSSSGSAAAVGAGLCDVALGTQTIGSITRPASFCGAVGYKPSFARVATDGVIPLAPSLDHVGCFTADVAGAAVVAAVLDGSRRVAEKSPQRPRLAVPVGAYLDRADDEGRSHFAAACLRLAEAGFEVVEVPAMVDFDAVEARHRRIVAAEAAAVHAEWFERYEALYAPETAELIARGRGISAEQLGRDGAGRVELRRELTRLLEEHGCDLWISPAARGAAPVGLASTGDPVMNLPWTHAGLPTLGIPAGRGASGLPIGVQLAARFQADDRLFGWALHLEAPLAAGEPA